MQENVYYNNSDEVVDMSGVAILSIIDVLLLDENITENNEFE
jgi:hypothetical protein